MTDDGRVTYLKRVHADVDDQYAMDAASVALCEFRLSRVWASEMMQDVKSLHGHLLNVMACRVTSPEFQTQFDSLIVVYNNAHTILTHHVPALVDIARETSAHFVSHSAVDDDAWNGEDEEASSSSPIHARAYEITQEYVTDLPSFIGSLATRIRDNLRKKFKHLLFTTQRMDVCAAALKILYDGPSTRIWRIHKEVAKLIREMYDVMPSGWMIADVGLPALIARPIRSCRRKRMRFRECSICCKSQTAVHFRSLRRVCKCTDEYVMATPICKTCMAKLMPRARCPYCRIMIK